MKCPYCGFETNVIDDLEYKTIRSGKGYNHIFGVEEHWFELEVNCPKCNEKFEYSDSSL